MSKFVIHFCQTEPRFTDEIILDGVTHCGMTGTATGLEMTYDWNRVNCERCIAGRNRRAAAKLTATEKKVKRAEKEVKAYEKELAAGQKAGDAKVIRYCTEYLAELRAFIANPENAPTPCGI